MATDEKEKKVIVEVLKDLITHANLPGRFTSELLGKLDSLDRDDEATKPTKCEHDWKWLNSAPSGYYDHTWQVYECSRCKLVARRKVHSQSLEYWPDPVDPNAKAISLLTDLRTIRRAAGAWSSETEKFIDVMLADLRESSAKLKTE